MSTIPTNGERRASRVALATRATGAVLNALIASCLDDIRAQTATSRVVDGERLHRLEDSVARRVSFVAELGELVRATGRAPRRAGTFFAPWREALASARTLVAGAHPGDSYAAASHAADRTAELYERALLRPLPDATRTVLDRQSVEIASNCRELRRARLLGGHLQA